ncbi:MAG: MBL fold metallo-hydrolase [Candidatus Harrisonbacteria bacterium CG10_big_fil_rev_8_21_14_0_10_40_38]|uniref:MBL fold metallo-hydrolase n=1 Tax=Candidatus Harrisonbacteria bacterium CG10_big_fil_rev_8_21_14_0_10_40_38 TaxID=1974583 RepID=A0A2H0US90_9BACT|nr:MAG: MBL fold metallo-hydrolase [Candidatus Harrisonbacteria bacterium CG10_big_fil_rev_8_21_14_0_10_40_38]
MKKFYWFLGIVGIAIISFYALNSYIYNKKQGEEKMPENVMENSTPVKVIPISHATAVLEWDNYVMYTDPVGGAQVFEGQKSPNIILVTDIHGDHLDEETLESVIGSATLIAPQAVKDKFIGELAKRVQVLANGDALGLEGFHIDAVPMYNIPESDDAFHTKGRGNGYVIEKDGFRVYVAGDTSGTPEMRALQNIDIAFIPMNLPYTMDVEEAADAVLAFKPKNVYPYHYRGQDGLSDINHFKELVNAGNPDINVVLLDWYAK